jgi:hypothetical protein
MLALLGGLGGVVVAQSEESDAAAFPTGAFMPVVDSYLLLEFDEDGTERAQDVEGRWVVHLVYATRGDLHTEMTHDSVIDPKMPVTYHGDFDGEHLSMELWGDDLLWHRNFVYADNTWTPVEDPRQVLFAYADFAPGDRVVTARGFAPAAETEPEAFTHDRQVELSRSIAAVPMSKGQPITPDMVEPPAE